MLVSQLDCARVCDSRCNTERISASMMCVFGASFLAISIFCWNAIPDINYTEHRTTCWGGCDGWCGMTKCEANGCHCIYQAHTLETRNRTFEMRGSSTEDSSK